MGAIVLSRVGSGAFSDDDLRLVQVLADQAAVALENARSLASRDRLVQELEALLQISRAGSTEHDEAALAGLVADILVRTSRADACVVSRWDEASAELEMLSWKGRLDCGQAGLRGDLARFPLTRRVLLDGQPQLVRSDRTGAAATETAMLRRVGATQALLLPLTAAGRSIGLLELYLASDERTLHGAGDRRSIDPWPARPPWHSRTCSCWVGSGLPRTWTRSRASTTTDTCRSG